MTEKRQHPRIKMTARVKFIHPDYDEASYETRDVARNGVFLCSGDRITLPVGTEVTVQDDEILNEPPLVRAKIVRIEAEGIALMFIED